MTYTFSPSLPADACCLECMYSHPITEYKSTRTTAPFCPTNPLTRFSSQHAIVKIPPPHQFLEQQKQKQQTGISVAYILKFYILTSKPQSPLHLLSPNRSSPHLIFSLTETPIGAGGKSKRDRNRNTRAAGSKEISRFATAVENSGEV